MLINCNGEQQLKKGSQLNLTLYFIFRNTSWLQKPSVFGGNLLLLDSLSHRLSWWRRLGWRPLSL